MAHLQRFGRGFTRRAFLEQTHRGLLRAGLFGSAWAAFLRSGSATAAYPDELLSIEGWSRGRLKIGDVIEAGNVEQVRTLLDPVRYRQIATMGRKLVLGRSTHDLSRLMPVPYLEATLRHRGWARFDADRNVVNRDGQPWIGGNPFPEPSDALQVFAAHTLSWGRHDVSVYPMREVDLDPQGRVQYEYAAVWAEMAGVGRTVLPPSAAAKQVPPVLRHQAVLFTAPNDVRGTSYLNIWPYDQRQFPSLVGYLPAFKRVRTLPTNQRFEPLVPGGELYLSDAWAAGDPFLTWGGYRIVHRGPHLAAISGNWRGDTPNWAHGTHGGAGSNRFWDQVVELVPEALVVEAIPVGFPRAPVARKQVWFDARTLVPFQMVSYDRRGEMFRHFDAAFSVYEDGRSAVKAGIHPYWSWTTVHAFNVQTERMTRMEQVREVAGGHAMRVDDPAVYDQYLTVAALQRLGA